MNLIKNSGSIMLAMLIFAFSNTGNAQTEMEIIGPDNSSSAVVKIIGGTIDEIVSAITLEVESANTLIGTGIAGMFTGDGTGVVGKSTNGTGLRGTSNVSFGLDAKSTHGVGARGNSTYNFGLEGVSTNHTGAYFKGGGGIAIELGGADSDYGQGTDDCVIKTQDDQNGGDMIIVSNDAIDLHLDDDTNSSSSFRVMNGGNDEIFELNESGNLTISGSLSQGSDFFSKHDFESVDLDLILENVSQLPISKWSYKSEDIRHIGPMSQDFYEIFGLGQGETTISAIDADGISLAAIKALISKNEKLLGRLDKQEHSIRELIARVSSLEMASSENTSSLKK